MESSARPFRSKLSTQSFVGMGLFLISLPPCSGIYDIMALYLRAPSTYCLVSPAAENKDVMTAVPKCTCVTVLGTVFTDCN